MEKKLFKKEIFIEANSEVDADAKLKIVIQNLTPVKENANNLALGISAVLFLALKGWAEYHKKSPLKETLYTNFNDEINNILKNKRENIKKKSQS